MTISTNEITRYDATNVREDLANVIYNISPVDVPFMSNIGRENVKNTYFEWQTDVLASAVTTNAQLEGDQITGADARVATDRVGNYSQISRKVIEVSGTLEAVDKAGMRSYLAYELAKAASELKRDMEAVLTSNQVAFAGTSTTARKTAGLGGWIITNSYKGTGTTAAAPVMSSGGTNLSGYPATAAVAGASRAFTSTLLKAAAKDVWTQGGKLRMLMVGPYNKTVFSTFSGIATLYRDVAPGKQAEITGASDLYVSDFGQISVVANRFAPEGNAYLIDPDFASVGYLRNFRTEVMSKTGDSERRMLLVEFGLKVRQQKAMAAIRDLATS
jgi:hypothetical protein